MSDITLSLFRKSVSQDDICNLCCFGLRQVKGNRANPDRQVRTDLDRDDIPGRTRAAVMILLDWRGLSDSLLFTRLDDFTKLPMYPLGMLERV